MKRNAVNHKELTPPQANHLRLPRLLLLTAAACALLVAGCTSTMTGTVTSQLGDSSQPPPATTAAGQAAAPAEAAPEQNAPATDTEVAASAPAAAGAEAAPLVAVQGSVRTPAAAEIGEEPTDDELLLAPSFMTVTAPGTQPVGKPIYLDVELLNEEAKPIPNKVLILHLNGQEMRRQRTDEDGRASIYMGRDLPVGDYHAEVEFIGTQAYAAETAAADFTIRPARLLVVTVPPLPGIGFTFEGKDYVSDADGLVHIDTAGTGIYSLAVKPLPEPAADATEMIEFERWDDGYFTPEREVNVRGDDEIYVGFAVSYKIGQEFVDLDNEAIDPARVSSLTLKSSTGSRYTYSNGQPRWRKANRIARLANGLEATEIQYAVESVIIDGANVVNQNQQRFVVTESETWQIQLLLYSARIAGKDALFGFPVGTGLRLIYPDGQEEMLPIGRTNDVHLSALARGLYQVQITGVRGIAPVTPVALSRNQDVELKVLTVWNMALGVVLGLVAAIGMLLYGRPEIVGLRRRRAPVVSPQSPATPALPNSFDVR